MDFVWEFMTLSLLVVATVDAQPRPPTEAKIQRVFAGRLRDPRVPTILVLVFSPSPDTVDDYLFKYSISGQPTVERNISSGGPYALEINVSPDLTEVTIGQKELVARKNGQESAPAAPVEEIDQFKSPPAPPAPKATWTLGRRGDTQFSWSSVVKNDTWASGFVRFIYKKGETGEVTPLPSPLDTGSGYVRSTDRYRTINYRDGNDVFEFYGKNSAGLWSRNSGFLRPPQGVFIQKIQAGPVANPNHPTHLAVSFLPSPDWGEAYQLKVDISGRVNEAKVPAKGPYSAVLHPLDIPPDTAELTYAHSFGGMSDPDSETPLKESATIIDQSDATHAPPPVMAEITMNTGVIKWTTPGGFAEYSSFVLFVYEPGAANAVGEKLPGTSRSYTPAVQAPVSETAKVELYGTNGAGFWSTAADVTVNRAITTGKFRDDHRCGEGHEAPGGGVAECDAKGDFPCCSTTKWCGNSVGHCECTGCLDYRDPPCQHLGVTDANIIAPLERTTYASGSVLTYSCKEGYYLVGGTTAVCREGKWSVEAAPTCEASPCKYPELTHDRLDVSPSQQTYTNGSEIKYACKEGYDLIGGATATCLLGKWYTEAAPSCRASPCKYPELTDDKLGVSPTQQTYTNGSQIKYTCAEGHALVGKATATCLRGKWNIEGAPTCKATGKFRDDHRCGEGHTAPDGGVAECDGKGDFPCCSTTKWCGNSVGHCECTGCLDYRDPPCQHLGVTDANIIAPLERTTYASGSILTYSCQKGYYLVGGTTAVCGAGKWSVDAAPTCKVSTCQKLQSTDADLIFAPNQTTYSSSSTVRYSCRDSYDLVGAATTTCENGTWTVNAAPTCRALAKLRSDHRCGQGYLAPGGGAAECDAKGDFPCCSKTNWCGNSAGHCECTGCLDYRALPCQNLGVIDVNIIAPPKRTAYASGSILTYSCKVGYDLVGGSTAVCQKGNWSIDKAPTCAASPCQYPSITDNMLLVSPIQTTYTNGSEITYTCKEGHDLFGDATASCHLGRWRTDAAPHCKASCGKLESKDGTLRVSPDESSYRSGSNITYTCPAESVLVGEATATCLDGKWSITAVPSCEVPCLKLTSTDATLQVSPDKASYRSGSSVTYTCQDGHDLKGEATAVCLNGVWSLETAPECIASTTTPGQSTDGGTHGGGGALANQQTSSVTTPNPGEAVAHATTSDTTTVATENSGKAPQTNASAAGRAVGFAPIEEDTPGNDEALSEQKTPSADAASATTTAKNNVDQVAQPTNVSTANRSVGFAPIEEGIPNDAVTPHAGQQTPSATTPAPKIAAINAMTSATTTTDQKTTQAAQQALAATANQPAAPAPVDENTAVTVKPPSDQQTSSAANPAPGKAAANAVVSATATSEKNTNQAVQQTNVATADQPVAPAPGEKGGGVLQDTSTATSPMIKAPAPTTAKETGHPEVASPPPANAAPGDSISGSKTTSGTPKEDSLDEKTVNALAMELAGPVGAGAGVAVIILLGVGLYVWLRNRRPPADTDTEYLSGDFY